MEKVMIEGWDLVAIFFVILATAVFSGATGGGGGFLTTPFLIALGLTPAQAVASGKPGGIAVTIGALTGLRGHKIQDKKLVVIYIAMSIIAGVVSPFFITSLDPEAYKTIIGIALLILAPIIYFKKVGHNRKRVSRRRRGLGFVAIAVSMTAVGIFSSGLGIFINISMMSMLGLNALDASVTKRLGQLFLNTTIIIGLLGSGLINWSVVAVLLISGSIGGYLGGKIAIKKGSPFVSTMTAIAAGLSGIYTLFFL